jgi:DNA replication initiation complex subunit (GINS family)
MGDVVITYETLYEIMNRENKREELQKLEDNFYEETEKYMKEKQNILDQPTEEMFAREEKSKTSLQIENAKKIIKNIFHKREKKIIDMALDTSRTGVKIMSTKSMLPAEKELYEKTVRLLIESKKDIMENKKPAEPIQENQEEKSKDLKEAGKTIKFKEDIQKFMGTDLKVYGPYLKENTADLPEIIADLLIRKGKAEEAK